MGTLNAVALPSARCPIAQVVAGLVVDSAALHNIYIGCEAILLYIYIYIYIYICVCVLRLNVRVFVLTAKAQRRPHRLQLPP